VQITQANHLYDSNVTRFEMHNNVCLKLKRMILAAVGDKYVSTLQHPLLRYAQVTVEALLQHLTDTYSEITQEVLENNRSKISAEWNPDNGIETIFTRITDAQQFAAAAGDDHIIPASTAMYLALTAIDNTGVFLEPCADWCKHHLGEQTLLTLLMHGRNATVVSVPRLPDIKLFLPPRKRIKKTSVPLCHLNWM
jgi:hypothetical protein